MPVANIGGNETNISAVLTYDSSGFIPHKKSDVAGIGWSLIAGGRITRNLNGSPDEYVGNNGTLLNPNAYGNVVDLHGFLKGVKTNPSTNNTQVYNVNGGGVGNTDGMNWWLGTYPNEYEGEPDEFSFNAMGLSGKFMIGNDGNVLVESTDTNIKVDLSEIALYGGALFCEPPSSKITLTDGNGTKYIFGGDLSKYEISYSYSTIPYYPNQDYLGHPMINSFSLSKVVFANGKEVNFEYEAGYFAYNTWCELNDWVTLGFNSKILSMDSYSQDGGRTSHFVECAGYAQNGTGCFSSYSTQDSSTDTFVMVKKSVLKSIKYEDDEIKINYINTGYPIMHYPVGIDSDKVFNEWVIDNIATYHKTMLLKKTQLSYEHLGGLFKRPFLKSVKDIYSDQTYMFEYGKTNDLPAYYTKGIDHWGYWNGNDGNTRLAPFDTYNNTTGDYTLNNTFRDASPYNYDVALLNKVIYPTKGFSTFEYEPHYYTKRIERTSSSEFLPILTNNGGLAGGARIKKISNYASSGELSSQKEYKYTTTLNGTTSSGILMNWPRYFYAISGIGLNGNNPTTSSWMLKTSSNVQKNSLDSYNVGYGKVFEIESNKGYVERDFTTYETHPDLYNPDGYNIRQYIGVGVNFTPLNLYKNFKNLYGVDKSILRGRPLTQKYFSQTDLVNPIKTVNYEYYDNMEFNPNNSKDNNKYVSVNHLTGAWVQGYRKFMNSALTKKITTTEYIGNIQVITKSENVFDSPLHLNLSKTNLTSPDNSVTQTTYSYSTAGTSLATANIIGIPLVTEIIKDNKIISKVETKYENPSPTQLYPSSSVSYDVQNPNSGFADVVYDQYDNKGNLLQYTTKDGVSTTIVWGYNKTKPIAKIEGAKLSDIQQSYIDSIVSAADTDNAALPNNDESTFLQTLKTFRGNLPNYQITTYTYDPLIGVRSITPPSGIREVYIYDSANRLKEVRENNQTGKLLKEFQYNYKH
ncbi:hypothetical protein ACN9MN_08085 [Chryseobacterium sp. S-02]|uniref:hypothetical protein n=1 Tax=Chryseobacterium sp. S-02 TaxID=3404064 RepID=UPI003CED327F